MKISLGKMVTLVIGVMTITGALVKVGIDVFDYHDTFATKIATQKEFLVASEEMNNRFIAVNKQINFVGVNSRLKDVEDSIKFYQRLPIELDEFGKEHYESLKTTLARLEHERDLLTGISTNP